MSELFTYLLDAYLSAKKDYDEAREKHVGDSYDFARLNPYTIGQYERQYESAKLELNRLVEQLRQPKA